MAKKNKAASKKKSGKPVKKVGGQAAKKVAAAAKKAAQLAKQKAKALLAKMKAAAQKAKQAKAQQQAKALAARKKAEAQKAKALKLKALKAKQAEAAKVKAEKAKAAKAKQAEQQRIKAEQAKAAKAAKAEKLAKAKALKAEKLDKQKQAKAARQAKQAAAKAEREAKQKAKREAREAKLKAVADAKAAKDAARAAAKQAKADALAQQKAAKEAARAEKLAARQAAKANMPAPQPSAPTARQGPVFLGPMPDKPLPRATKLPPPAEELTKREMEQVLTVGTGRGVQGEGSLKGRLSVHVGFPYLEVIGRDKRELYFLLQGPDQEVLPAYLDHKVSVSGFIRRTNNHGGTIDVRKYSAKKPEAEVVVEPVVNDARLKFLSPGEVEQVASAGMGAGMKGFAALRGTLEMTGDDFFLVVSNGGTRQQVSFNLVGAKGLKKMVGNTLHVTGVVEKTSGWGGTIEVETCEPRPAERLPVVRDGLEVVEIESRGEGSQAEVKVNTGLSVRFPEKAGFTWAVEPTTAKRVGLREANFEVKGGGPATREFFFTPRNPGQHEVEFFLAKAFNPMQVSKTWKLTVNVKQGETT